jgi:hypothetical protein
MNVFAQEENGLFLYIPDNATMSEYFNLRNYLNAWDNNEFNIDDDRLSRFFQNFVGEDTLESLLFESFLRYTKNKTIQNQVINFINSNNINTNFTNSLRKIYSAVPIVRQSEGKNVTQYNYNNIEFDENINLFYFNENYAFNNELGFLLFENDWNIITFNPQNDNEQSFTLLFGGGTNSMSIRFTKYLNVAEENIESKYRENFYNERYNGNWRITPLPLEGILSRSGADKIVIAHGLGSDNHIEIIETVTLNVYLYKKSENILYEVSYFMNVSPVNIHFAERNRIFNLLFFQILFVFIK